MIKAENILETHSLFCVKCHETILESVNFLAFICQKELVASMHSKECNGTKLKLED